MNLKKILCGTLGASLLLSSTACSAAPAQQAAPAASAEKFDHLPPRRPPQRRLMALCRF